MFYELPQKEGYVRKGAIMLLVLCECLPKNITYRVAMVIGTTSERASVVHISDTSSPCDTVA